MLPKCHKLINSRKECFSHLENDMEGKKLEVKAHSNEPKILRKTNNDCPVFFSHIFLLKEKE